MAETRSVATIAPSNIFANRFARTRRGSDTNAQLTEQPRLRDAAPASHAVARTEPAAGSTALDPATDDRPVLAHTTRRRTTNPTTPSSLPRCEDGSAHSPAHRPAAECWTVVHPEV
jgi:hypothetical protein